MRTHRAHTLVGPRSIGGKLDAAGLARLHFITLDRGQQAQSVRRMAASGQSDHAIAAATGLAVEMVRRTLADREPTA